MAAQLRVLVGLPDAARPAAAGAAALGPAAGALQLSWLEAHALQLGCARAHLHDASADLLSLRTMLERYAGYARSEGGVKVGGGGAVFEAAELAHTLALNASRLVEAAQYGAACAEAGAAARAARTALHHPALLPVSDGSEGTAIATYAPLFFPIASVTAAAAYELYQDTRRDARVRELRAQGRDGRRAGAHGAATLNEKAPPCV